MTRLEKARDFLFLEIVLGLGEFLETRFRVLPLLVFVGDLALLISDHSWMFWFNPGHPRILPINYNTTFRVSLKSGKFMCPFSLISGDSIYFEGRFEGMKETL
ncbi:MAG: hypothetical protein IH886_04295 [Nitrospinae bacterium]|nr:hypothetical protein [Nitrospinota bacterium]